MSVIRIKKHQANYVCLQKEILENDQISLKAKGFWAFCMAKPDDWEFKLKNLIKTLLEGREAIYKALQELIKFGYCRRIQNKDAYGRWTTVDYEILETSQLKEKLPQTCFPDPDNRHTENQHLLSINGNQVKKRLTPIPPLDKIKIWEEEFSSITPKDWFEQAWEEYEAQPIGQVKNVIAWLKAVIQRYELEAQTLCNKKSRRESHEDEARAHDNYGEQNTIIATNKYVEFVIGTHVKQVPYDVSDEEWEKSAKPFFRQYILNEEVRN
jgi:hypothetical protein